MVSDELGTLDARREEAPVSSDAALPPIPADRSDDVRAIAEAFWIVLGREVGPVELRDQLRGFRPADVDGLAIQLLSTPEFGLTYVAWKEGTKTDHDLETQERGLRALGPDAWFVGRAYQLLLGRPVDDSGLTHFVEALASGEARVGILRSLGMSEEFSRRYHEIARRRAGAAISADALLPPIPAERSEDVRAITEAFWIVLGREVDPIELRDQLRGFRAADVDGLVIRLLSATEFRLMYVAWKDGMRTGRDLRAQERGLCALGPDDWFVSRAYQFLFGRPVDDDGLRHFVAALASGEKRLEVLRSLAVSEEFSRRYQQVAPQGGFIPRDTQLCELANPAKWDNPEWLALLRDLQVLSDNKMSMHRKTYEFTQLLYGMRRLGALRDDAAVLSVGAGHECVLYWLANHVARVVATDLYEGIWQSIGAKEGDEQVIVRPGEYAPFPYRRDRLTFLKMDGQRLAFRSNTFDVVYSLSSIEHFGGLRGAEVTLDEMARVLKPGGLAVVATEYVLSGPAHEETFLPHEVAALLDRPRCGWFNRSTTGFTIAMSTWRSMSTRIRTRLRIWSCASTTPSSRR